jgi:tetratricopeptide (TPR) repeat protein
VTTRVVVRAFALTLALLLAGCGRQTSPSAASAASTPALQPVTLPDISRAAPAVQDQLRQQYDVTTRAVAVASASPESRANAYGDLGKLLIATEFYEGAERCFQNARLLSPREMRWPYYLAQVARLANDPAKAAALFEQTLALQPDHVPSLVWLANIYLTQSQAARARPLLEKARTLEPREAAVLYGLGRVALEERQYAEAVADLEAALALVPSASRVHYPLAMAYRAAGDTNKAQAQLKLRGDEDLPPADGLMGEIGSLLKNAEALETRGVRAMDAGRWSDAVDSLEQAVRAAPANAFTRLNLGTSLYMSGHADRALEQYRTAVRLSPGLARAHFGIGVILEERQQDTEAIEAYTRAVDHDAGLVEARFALANALRRANRADESLPHYEAILRLNPAASQASFGYTMALVRLGRYEEARARLENDAAAYPDQPGFAHALARVLAAAPDDRVRDGGRALSLTEQLLRTQPRSPVLLETMAMALAEVGRFADAVRAQSDAMMLTGGGGARAHLAANLGLYQRGRPCRTPWADDDPVHHPQAGSR